MASHAKADKTIDGRDYRFGLNSESIATQLQHLADEIRLGRILPQEMVSSVKNVAGDFESITISVTYAEPK